MKIYALKDMVSGTYSSFCHCYDHVDDKYMVNTISDNLKDVLKITNDEVVVSAIADSVICYLGTIDERTGVITSDIKQLTQHSRRDWLNFYNNILKEREESKTDEQVS